MSSITMDVSTPPISIPTRIIAVVGMLFRALVSENFLLWSFRQGKWNENADLEGPYYIPGAPERNIEPGKAQMVAVQDLKENIPFLVTGQVLSSTGAPIPNVSLDCWQADSFGHYALTKYRLRGTVLTDAEGYFECLTVAPGKYGPATGLRAGHIHAIVRAKTEQFTTQMYLCQGNNPDEMGTDMLNWVRTPRRNNMIETFCIPSDEAAFASAALPASSGSKHFMDLPSVDESGSVEKMKKSIDWWNRRLQDEGVRVQVVGHKVFRMGGHGKAE
ncbi:Intradiol ring-cleavage dioxygenase [Mycena floridula]|nr:Intradiol ring-cleavage dioxygenase [Mycena floridula]